MAIRVHVFKRGEINVRNGSEDFSLGKQNIKSHRTINISQKKFNFPKSGLDTKKKAFKIIKFRFKLNCALKIVPP